MMRIFLFFNEWGFNTPPYAYAPSTALYFSWISTIRGGPGSPVALRGTLASCSRLFSQKLSARPW